MLGRIPRLVMAAPIVAALAVTLAASGGSPVGRAGSDLPALKSITSRLDGAVSTVLIEASEPVAYLTSQPNPLTVLVDLRNIQSAGLEARPINALAPVAGVVLEDATAPDGSPVARIRVSLDHAARHRVRSSRNMILVEVDRSAPASPAMTIVPATAVAAAAPRAMAVRSTPAAAESRATATELRSVKGGAVPNGYAVTLSANGPLVASSIEEVKDLPARVLLDFRGVGNGRVPATTAINEGDVERVRVATNSRDPLITRVVIDLARKIPYTVETVGEELRVLFKSVVDATAAAVAPAAPTVPVAPAPEPARPVEAPAVVGQMQPTPPQAVASVAASPAPAAVSVASALAVLQAVPAPPPAPAPAVLQSLTPPNSQIQRQFTGHLVTLDFQGADLRAVLRTFAEISGLNIVIDPTINGTVDVSLREVPWDQALDIILRANKLGYSVDGTIVRIVPTTVLAQENEERRKLADAEATAGVLRTVTVPLSYAKAADLVAIVTRSVLSPRGDVQIDARTNTLIIRDLPDRLTGAVELLNQLDKPQPQVEIEARIVSVTRAFSKDLGIQWGMSGRVDPALGTSTGLAFPNNGTLRAEAGSINAAAPTLASLALGSINGALNLDVALRALERTGKARLLSSPRVVTQNNVEAEITQGSQIPIQTVSNNTVTVTFKDAALTLKVTPQITASNTVIMKIFVEKAAPNYTQTTPEAPTPSIDTQRAVTSVLVADGDTTVLGGIFESLTTFNQDRTPVLHRVPFLGWLFRSDSQRDNDSELLIFITPRIAQ
ncbi:MAG: type IV pilus secretin PilQ [Vicinamibacterales bacterium]